MSTLLSAINASASALDAQRARMEVAVSNLANAESTRSADGRPYRRREVVLEAAPFDPATPGAQFQASGVRVAAVLEDQSEFRKRYEPSHPDADAEGFVSTPNVVLPVPTEEHGADKAKRHRVRTTASRDRTDDQGNGGSTDV